MKAGAYHLVERHMGKFTVYLAENTEREMFYDSTILNDSCSVSCSLFGE